MQLLGRAVLARGPAPGRAPGTRLRPANARCDTSDLLVETAKQLGFVVEFLHARTPEDSGMAASFHTGLDREHLDLHEFESEGDAARFIETAFVDYNETKPKERWAGGRPAMPLKQLKENVDPIEVKGAPR